MGNVLELYLNGTLCKDCGVFISVVKTKEARTCKTCAAKQIKYLRSLEEEEDIEYA